MNIDFHVHTTYSYDACDTPKKMIDQAIEIGLDGICVTDHNNVDALPEAEAYAKSKNFLLIPGIEVHTQDGHILGINVRGSVESGMKFEETVSAIRQMGGIAVIAHPFLWRSGFTAWDRIDLSRAKNFIDGIEISNASGTFRANMAAENLIKRHALPFIAGSDAHVADFVGKRFLEIPGAGFNADQIIALIMSGSAASIRGRQMTLLEKINTSSTILRRGASAIRIERREIDLVSSSGKLSHRVTVGGKDINLRAIFRNRWKRIIPKIKYYLNIE